jgi:uncharacterized protein YjbI with pentapeptide repeats
VKIIKPDNLALLFKSFVWGEKCYLSLGACAFFHLDTKLPNRLMLDQDMWPIIQDALGKGEVFDFAHPKVRGEFLVYGSCFASRPVPALEAAVRIGSLTKRLAVFGNRWWQAGGIPGAPESFQRIPITYDYAYGGPAYPPNPLGKGHEADATGRQPLPNIQDPARLMGSPKETPPVAGLAAYPLTWPQRTRHLGKFDGDWLAESWPHFPADTNLEYFNTAPENQRLEGFFKGDEAIEILHMHPRQERLVSALPALRARLFVRQSEGGKEVFKEVPARAETVWLFPDRECGIVLYRGAVAVGDEEYEDIIHVLAAWESLGEPARAVAEYQAALAERLAPPSPPEEPAPLPPPEEPAVPVPPPAADTGAVNPALAGMAAEAAALMATATTEMKKFGIDPEAAMKKFMPLLTESEPATLDDLMTMATRLQEETKATLARFGLDEKAAQKLLEPKPAAPSPSPEEIIGNLRKAGIANPEIETQVKAAHKMGEEAMAALKELEKVKEQAAGDFEKVAAAAATPAPPPRAAALTVAEVLARRQRGESLRGLDLTGLDFTGCDLAGADFTGAVMTKTIFRKANLKGTVFRDAVLTESDFTEAVMEGAVLAGANATQGTFARAVLVSADLSRGDFTGADFREGSAQGAVLSGAVFEKAIFMGFKGEKAKAVQAVFAGADLTEANFNYADLTGGDLSNTNLSFAAFGKAKADGLRLYGAKGEATVFGDCSLTESRADKDTAFENIRLSRANLTGANWEGARLSRAQMVETVLDGADFSRCDLSGAVTFRVSAKGTNFMKANFHEANLTGINLFKGSLRKARLTRTDLQFSNLYGVDLYKAKLGKTNLTDTNIKNTLLTLKVDI